MGKMKIFIFAALAAVVVICHGNDDELFRKVTGNIPKESFAETTLIEEGQIPEWIDGSFIRQGCGAWGDSGSVGSGLQEEGVFNHIDHLFDCFGTGTTFKIQDGDAKFTNRFWPQAEKMVYDDFEQNMNESRVFMRGALGYFDLNKFVELRPNVSSYTNEMVPEKFPQVSFWQIGDRVVAASEGLTFGWVNVHNASSKGVFPYAGENPGDGGFPIGNPAHEQMDRDGTVWSMIQVHVPGAPGESMVQWVIYKITPEGRRSVVKRHVIGFHDLSKCEAAYYYPELEARVGYMHAFAMSENYIIMPESSWLADPCSIFVRQTSVWEPFLRGQYQWYPEFKSRVHVFRKSDGEHMGTLQYEKAIFITHFANTYEEGDKIHMDTFIYDDAEIYLHSFRAENLIKDEFESSTFARMTLDLTDMTLTTRALRSVGKSVNEFPQFNRAYNQLPYKFTYFVQNPYILGGAIVKINVETGEETSFVLPSKTLPFEPYFVARPDATDEDDGILLVQATDLARDKTLLVILDARTMTLEAQVLAPDISLPGLHNNFYPCHIGGEGDGDRSACKQLPRPTGAAATNHLSYLALILFFVLISHTWR